MQPVMAGARLLCLIVVLSGAMSLPGCGEKRMSEPWIQGPAGKRAVDDGGTGGLPVVFAHSLAGNAGQWKQQLEHVRRSRRAVAFDFRGHGSSEPAVDGGYSIADMAEDIAAVVEAAGLKRFVLVGHSMGGGA